MHAADVPGSRARSAGLTGFRRPIRTGVDTEWTCSSVKSKPAASSDRTWSRRLHIRAASRGFVHQCPVRQATAAVPSQSALRAAHG